MELAFTALLIVVLLSSAIGGLWLRQQLGDRHLSSDAVDSIRLLMGMLLTFAAIVLGLLTSSAKQRFDSLSDDLSAYGVRLIELDNELRAYGPGAALLRTELRRYTLAALQDTWPDEFGSGTAVRLAKPREGQSPMESMALGRMVGDLADKIAGLVPQDDYHRYIGQRLREQVAQVIQQRWGLISKSGSATSWPFMTILTVWLAIIFAIFGMTSPRGPVVYFVVVLTALSIASPLYLILEYDSALTGTIVLPSAPLREALAHMDAPDER